MTIQALLEQVSLLARVYGWYRVKTSPFSGLISFKRKGVRLNIWYEKMTVGTCLEHPKLGATQLFRRNVSMRLLEEIFNNPRIHTGKGYRFKSRNNYKDFKYDKATTAGRTDQTEKGSNLAM